MLTLCIKVDEELCAMEEERPSSVSQCEGSEECRGGGRDSWNSWDSWDSGPWSPCSARCGLGTQTRAVTCRPGHRCEGDRPPTSRHCRGTCHHNGAGWVRVNHSLELEDEEEEDSKVNMTSKAEFLETSGQSPSSVSRTVCLLLITTNMLANLRVGID